MYSAQIENDNGSLLRLTQNESNWKVIDISGLNPPNATISATKLAGYDGARYNSATLNTRNIVIKLALTGNVEANRLLLYSMFPIKSLCTFYYQTESRNVKIDGYIENVDCPMYVQLETMQVSIICPDPYFVSLYPSDVNISKNMAVTEFPLAFNGSIPFSIYDTDAIVKVINPSEVPTGLIITVDFVSTASPPSIPLVSSFTLQNEKTGEHISIQYDFNDGDRLIINTNRGQKNIIRIRNGVALSLLSNMTASSDFLQLNRGENLFSYTPNVATAKLSFSILYGGV